MSALEDVTRPFWLPGLNEVSGNCIKGLGGWICDEEYQVYNPPKEARFTLRVSHSDPVLQAYAAEINRISVAAFETVSALARSQTFPKSTGWLVVKTYYSAFFAAHAFLRMLGKSCAPLDREHTSSITTVAEAYGNGPPAPMMGGLYCLTFDSSANQLEGIRVIGSLRAGPHEAFWLVFHEQVKKLSSDVLQTTAGTLKNRQVISAKLSDLASNLCFGPSSKGHWLSTVRNAVNYEHSYFTWYPYGRRDSYYDQLFEKTLEWKADPEALDLVSHEGRDLRRFQVTCNFIIAMLRVSIAEMARRCSTGRSFHTYGAVAFLNLLGQRRET